MPEYRLSLDFTAADDQQAARLAEAWAGTCAAEYGTRYVGFELLPETSAADLCISDRLLAGWAYDHAYKDGVCIDCGKQAASSSYERLPTSDLPPS